MKEKIQKLEAWLVENPDHPDYCLVWQDKNKLEMELLRNKHQRIMNLLNTISSLKKIAGNPEVKKAEKDGFSIIFQNSTSSAGYLGLEFVCKDKKLNTELVMLPLKFTHNQLSNIVKDCRNAIQEQIENQ